MSVSGQSANIVRIMLALRADQNRMFGEPLSAQAWDLIFVLFLAEAEGRRTGASDAAFIAGIDPEAGKRWIAHLRQLGVVIDGKGEEQGGGGRTQKAWVTLSPDALGRLTAFVRHAQLAIGGA